MDEKTGYQDLTISSGGVSEHVTADELASESTEAVNKAQLREAARKLNARVPAGTQLRDPKPLEQLFTKVIRQDAVKAKK